MKQDRDSNEWVPAVNLSTEINLKAYREEVFFLIISLKTVFENFNLHVYISNQ